MNRAWMRQKLQSYRDLLEEFIRLKTPWGTSQGKALVAELHRQEPTVKEILKRLDPGLADFVLDAFGGEHASPSGVLTCVHKGLGILDDQEEWAVRLLPDAPVLPADQFHPWVWDSARTLWETGHYRQAVHTAASAITAKTQAKLNRRELADKKLLQEAFTSAPRPGVARLVVDTAGLSGESASGMQAAVNNFAAGCYQGIRNPAAHEHDVDWDEQPALEYLAALSVLARWIDKARVEIPSRSVSPQRRQVPQPGMPPLMRRPSRPDPAAGTRPRSGRRATDQTRSYPPGASGSHPAGPASPTCSSSGPGGR